MMADRFGDCCEDLAGAMREVPNSFVHVEDNGVIYLTVGYVQTEDGPGYFDQAMMFCPFCGKRLQTPERVASSE